MARAANTGPRVPYLGPYSELLGTGIYEDTSLGGNNITKTR